jgi:hypothetical protein
MLSQPQFDPLARRHRAPSDVFHRLACNDNSVVGGCPSCNKVSPADPTASEYRAGEVYHHWHCHDCGHDWVTVVHLRQ